MADEWSKPVKGADGVTRMAEVSPVGRTVAECDGERVFLCVPSEAEEVSAPREVVIRLLAAEASDRLGWVWVPDADNDGRIVGMDTAGGSNYVIWRESGVVAIDAGDFTPDELLAAMHGRFLLEEALREAGR